MNHLRIAGGLVYDPANAVDGDVRDICIEDGRIVASLPVTAPRLDARGMVVMPGGVDMHCHVASSSVNVGLPERSVRSTSVFRNNPTKPSLSTRLRPAMGTPMLMS